ncbi:AIPR family protein [Caulobacter sp. DWR1-3-2b1]|uniref:AIPR family protein n=1 Tax=Caulobacter sp. DWR1-3-2b1 TaxID=2804670 RepID=UPI003CEA9291
MSATDTTILMHLFGEAKKADYPKLPEADFFEIYVPYHHLKHFDLDYADIENGIVDGAKDGGIDSVYCLCDGRLISDFDNSAVRKNPDLDLFIFTNKFQESFPTSALNDLRVTLSDLMDFDKAKLSQVFKNYNDEVWEAFLSFRTFYISVASKFPSLSIHVIYATKSPKAAEAEVLSRLAQIADDLKTRFSGATVEATASDARSLLSVVREPPDEVRSLQISGNSVNLSKGPSYVALAKLHDYYAFISKSGGGLEQRLFDDNVRDYEGDVLVNKEIGATLADGGDIDFWWLNNGASIICDSATLSGSMLQMKNPKIVNGLQTSRRIYEHFSGISGGLIGLGLKDDRLVLVRVITAEDDDVRAEIIRATNRQTPISPAQLIATSAIHKDIELHLRAEGKYYERRKNFWKNQGKTKAEIITVTDMAQAVMTVVSGRPHTARARPGSLLKESNNDVFDASYDIRVYAKAIDLVRGTEALINEELPDCGVRDRNNLKYHIVARIVYDSCGGKFSAKRFLANDLIEPDRRRKVIAKANSIYLKRGASDRVAKSEEFWEAVRDARIN